MLNRSASLAMSTCVLKALPGKLDIKRHSPSILFLFDMLAQMRMIPMIQARTQPYFTGALLYIKTHMRTHLKLKYGMLLSQI